jgi:hypothetical protein
MEEKKAMRYERLYRPDIGYRKIRDCNEGRIFFGEMIVMQPSSLGAAMENTDRFLFDEAHAQAQA